MNINNRFIYGILSLVLAAIISFVAIPAITQKTSSTCEIVRMKNTVKRGEPVTDKDIELVEIGEFNLPSNVARKQEDIIGTFAATDLFPGDYILPEKVSSVPLSSDLILNEIPDGKVAISITTQTLATALSDKLQDGDIIRLYHYNDENILEPVTDIPEFRFLKVLSVTDAKGLDIDYTTPPEEEEERQQTTTITVLASPEQAMLLTRYENEGKLHVALISRGNAELSKELLERQDKILASIYDHIVESGDEFMTSDPDSFLSADDILEEELNTENDTASELAEDTEDTENMEQD